MERNNNKRRKNKNLYYAAIALFLIISGVLGTNDQDVNINNNADFAVESKKDIVDIIYTFRNDETLESHYEKHGMEMGFDSAEEYLAAANKALANPDILHKIEAEDGDDVYYLEASNEFIVVSTDGYIRTYYYPSDGIDYFNRQ